MCIYDKIAVSPKCFVIRADAWAGLTKPIETFKAGDIKDCAIKCNILKTECGLIQYNDQTKDCSTAKVVLAAVNPQPTLLRQIDCVWDVYEMKPKRFDGCDAPNGNVTTVYIGVDVKDCPCPWEASCVRIRVSGPYDDRAIYG